MNLEQAIHQRWAESEPLESLLSAAKLSTGHSGPGAAPYAAIAIENERPRVRTNAGAAVDQVALTVHIWHDDYNAGRAVVEQVSAVFDRWGFSLAGEDRAVRMRRISQSSSQHDDGMWQFTVMFVIDIYFAVGV